MASKNSYQEVLNRMAHIMSHKVRQPIGTISGLVHLMEQDLVTEDECLSIIHDMRKCVNNLEMVSRELAALIHEEQSKQM